MEAASDGNVSLTLTCVAKEVEVPVTGTLSTSAPTSSIFKGLDCSVTIGGNAIVANTFNIDASWNIDDNEGRGIESVSSGERRLIQRVTKHRLDVNGSIEAQVDDNIDFGYEDERSNEAIVFTLSRGTDNEHVFTFSTTRSTTKEIESNIDNSLRVISIDYEAFDVAVTGDL